VAALDALAVSPASVEGQNTPTGTVTLSAPAPAGGAVVSLQSGNTDVAKVPGSVTVPAGSTTATFVVDTSTTPTTREVTIQGTYLGVTRAFVLTVRSPALIARFTVTSGTRGLNSCEIINAGGNIDCRFDATASGGIISRYTWLLLVGTHESSFPYDQPVYTPGTDCSQLTGASVDSNGSIGMLVQLRIEDRNGNTSTSGTTALNIYHKGFCGY
jgi:hypothetical protein